MLLKFALRPNILDAPAIRQSADAMFPEREKQAACRPFPVENRNQPMPKGRIGQIITAQPDRRSAMEPFPDRK